ncbi:MAG: ribose-phosphate pyrophosphokinase [Chloroflexi bacterium]|nr:ribose-phosphate pyrophosphokinase [Chloroflexota bacterium]
MNEPRIFTGNANPALAQKITEYLKISVAEAEVFTFSNDNIFVRLIHSVRGKDVYVVQPMSAPVNHNIMELLIMIDALKRASADRITAVVPYYGYSRTDKKDQPRVPITARLVADLLEAAGAHRVLTLDFHAAQIQGFFKIPVDELTALDILVDYFTEKKIKNGVVVATDIGISKRARDMAEKLQMPLAIMEKRRGGNDDKSEVLRIIGEVKGKTAIIVDDEIDTAGSLCNTAKVLQEQGALIIYSCATHAVFSGPAYERMEKAPIEEIVVTDTIAIPADKKLKKITVLSCAPLLGEAIHRINSGMSIGEMFGE